MIVLSDTDKELITSILKKYKERQNPNISVLDNLSKRFNKQLPVIKHTLNG